MASSLKEGPVIGVVGPTGAGKTSLVEGLKNTLGFHIHREEPGENPYFEAFYNALNQGIKPNPHALDSQLHFLRASYQQSTQIEALRNGTGVAWDVPPLGHRMYAYLLHESGDLSDGDYRIYSQEFDRLSQSAIQPDVTVVATTDIKTLVNRIKKRGRPQELNTPLDYWGRHISYWDQQMQDNPMLLRADSGEIDWLQESGVRKVWSLVQPMLGMTSQ